MNKGLEPTFELTLSELKALNRIIHKTYINYDDPEAQKVATKIYKLVDENKEYADS